MNLALGENADHHHTFKIRYKLSDGGQVMIDPICKCAGCQVVAHIKVDVDRVLVTLVSKGEAPLSYSVVLFGEPQP